jgi:electron transfer flavoprotein alpha/beta subunit
MRRVAVILGSLGSADPNIPPDLPPALPRSDRAAVELALKLKSPDVAIDAYCLRDDLEAMRYALASGVVTGTRLDDVAALEFDVALIGCGGAGSWGDLLPAMLAERRECAMVLDVLDIEPHADGIRVTRDLGHGSREVLAISGPAVLGVAEDAARSVYISRHRRQAAPVSRSSPGDAPRVDPLAAVSGPWEQARPRVKTAHLSERTGGSATDRMSALFGISTGATEERDRGQVIVDDAATCARHLLRFLGHHGLIERSGPPPAGVEPRGDQGPRAPRSDPAPPPAARPGRPARGPRPVDQSTTTRARGPRPVERDPQPDE